MLFFSHEVTHLAYCNLGPPNEFARKPYMNKTAVKTVLVADAFTQQFYVK